MKSLHDYKLEALAEFIEGFVRDIATDNKKAGNAILFAPERILEKLEEVEIVFAEKQHEMSLQEGYHADNG